MVPARCRGGHHGIMADENADSLRAQPRDVSAFLLVAALDGVALSHQDLGNRTHADAANADDMERPDVARHLHVVGFPWYDLSARQIEDKVRKPLNGVWPPGTFSGPGCGCKGLRRGHQVLQFFR